MSTRYIWRVHKCVPHLHIQPGDYLVYEPSCPDVWTVHRPAGQLDFGAVMAADEAGEITLAEFRPRDVPPLHLVSTVSRPPAVAPPSPRARRRASRPRGAA